MKSQVLSFSQTAGATKTKLGRRRSMMFQYATAQKASTATVTRIVFIVLAHLMRFQFQNEWIKKQSDNPADAHPTKMPALESAGTRSRRKAEIRRNREAKIQSLLGGFFSGGI